MASSSHPFEAGDRVVTPLGPAVVKTLDVAAAACTCKLASGATATVGPFRVTTICFEVLPPLF
jgi:hypothetical protein